MSITSLNRSYITILDSHRKPIGFGGNQAWFSAPSWSNISRQGCGIISAVDFALYCSNKSQISIDEYNSKVFEFLDNISFSKLFLHQFLNSDYAIGIVPLQICNYIHTETGLKARWNGIHGQANLLSKMKEMINNNFPIIWSLYSFRKSISLYSYDHENAVYKASTKINSHYVNVISIIEAPTASEHAIMLEVSSWGKQYFIDFNEYLAYVGNSPISKYASNIVTVSYK